MTGKGKKKESNPVRVSIDSEQVFCPSKTYSEWKNDYQRREGKQYKWPVL